MCVVFFFYTVHVQKFWGCNGCYLPLDGAMCTWCLYLNMETSLLKNKMLFILKGTAAKVPQVGTETVIKQ